MTLNLEEISAVMNWLDRTGPTPERESVVKILEIAAEDPECMIEPNWPILRIARYDHLEGLRRNSFVLLWAFAWAAVARSQCVDLYEPSIGREAFRELQEKLESMTPRQQGLIGYLFGLYESGESAHRILQISSYLFSCESGKPS